MARCACSFTEETGTDISGSGADSEVKLLKSWMCIVHWLPVDGMVAVDEV